MSKDLSAEYLQNNKERLRKKACENYQCISEEQKGKKSNNMCVNDINISLKMKNKN